MKKVLNKKIQFVTEHEMLDWCSEQSVSAEYKFDHITTAAYLHFCGLSGLPVHGTEFIPKLLYYWINPVMPDRYCSRYT